MRGLGLLTLLSVAALAAAALVTGDTSLAMPKKIPTRISGLSIDIVSFAIGVLAGVFASWSARFPWADIPRAILAAIAGWRRNMMLASLALACTGVLLFY